MSVSSPKIFVKPSRPLFSPFFFQLWRGVHSKPSAVNFEDVFALYRIGNCYLLRTRYILTGLSGRQVGLVRIWNDFFNMILIHRTKSFPSPNLFKAANMKL